MSAFGPRIMLLYLARHNCISCGSSEEGHAGAVPTSLSLRMSPALKSLSVTVFLFVKIEISVISSLSFIQYPHHAHDHRSHPVLCAMSP